MKKILSVVLVLVMLLSSFSVTASALSTPVVMSGYYDAIIDDICYALYEDESIAEAYVAGYMMDADKIEPAGAVTIPETITYRGNDYVVTGVETGAFSQSLFTSITLPSTITYMGDSAFMSSDYLEQVVIPEDCRFNYFGDMVFIGTPFEAEIYSKDEMILGQNVLFSYIGNADEYIIPENVEIIATNAFFMSGVKSVVINENITEIPYCAFASCRNLTSIDIPDNIEYIGEGAFKDCTSLETVILGEGVSTLGLGCFANTNIKSIHLGANVSDVTGAFKDCKTLETITVDEANTAFITDENALYFNAQAYYEDLLGSLLENSNIEIDLGYFLEYYLPSKAQGTVTLIPEISYISPYAFYGCKELKEVVAADSIEIGENSFANSGIEKFTATNIYYVWDGAFRNCKNLKEIDLSSTTYFGVGAFENCTALTKVEFAEDVYNIGELAFSNTGLTEVTIYGDECYIYESAFKGCKKLESVKLEEGVYYVGMNAFLDCPELKTISLSKTIKIIEDNAFNGCDDVTFELIKGTTAYKYIKNKTDFNFEVVRNYTFFQRIIDFFRALFGLE